MNRDINPVVVIVVIVVAVIGAGVWLWSRAQGTTFTKSSVRGIQLDVSKTKGLPPPTGP
ncbi:MAG: hypothetical protein HUU17_02175 [Chthonomonadales bacterium]|nr:hypothetical protein [Chthonomonadales bacterium]